MFLRPLAAECQPAGRRTRSSRARPWAGCGCCGQTQWAGTSGPDRRASAHLSERDLAAAGGSKELERKKNTRIMMGAGHGSRKPCLKYSEPRPEPESLALVHFDPEVNSVTRTERPCSEVATEPGPGCWRPECHALRVARTRSGGGPTPPPPRAPPIPPLACHSPLRPVVLGRGPTPVKILFRLRLQKFVPGVVPEPLVRVGAMVRHLK